MNNDLKAIKARLDKASPGPWRALTGLRQHDPRYANAVVPMLLSNDEHALCEFSHWMSDGDRALVVNARSDIERLYDEVRTLRCHLRDVLHDADEAAVDAARAYLAERGE